MNWYLTKLVFRITCGDGNHPAQFDEQLRLISAADRLQAFTKAGEMGKKESEIFYNQQRELIQWQFINVSELYALTPMIDGAELYSHVEVTDDGNAYAAQIHKKAEYILHAGSHQLLHLA
jgi:hypothetical protein